MLRYRLRRLPETRELGLDVHTAIVGNLVTLVAHRCCVKVGSGRAAFNAAVKFTSEYPGSAGNAFHILQTRVICLVRFSLAVFTSCRNG